MVKKILVIEEQVRTRNFFLEGLRAEGFHAIDAENGQIGIQRAREVQPDLIICSIMLSKVDGYSILTTLRQDPTTATIPFIFVTAKVSRSDFRKAMELGADDYLTKPCTVEELTRAIVAQLEKQNILRQWYTAQPQLPPKLPPAEPETTSAIAQPNWASVPLLNEVFRFIENNYHRAIALSDVAEAVGYSPAYLTDLIRRRTGQTIQQWIIERRMAAARSLLLETDQSVEQIAAQVGYHHTVHFFRQFRQLHHTTPQTWRATQRMNSSLTTESLT